MFLSNLKSSYMTLSVSSFPKARNLTVKLDPVIAQAGMQNNIVNSGCSAESSMTAVPSQVRNSRLLWVCIEQQDLTHL